MNLHAKLSLRPLSAAAVKAMLGDGAELALIDLREELTFSQNHLLWARNVPLSRLELRFARLVPRKATRIVLIDDNDGLTARAADVLARAGYSDISYLDGGVAAWETAGFVTFSGVHVPSKAFGEFVEHDSGTPSVSAAELDAMMKSGTKMVVLDSRPFDEYSRISIPSGINVPGAELVLRVHDIAPAPDTTIVVNCAGRTRSIIGAQALRNAGFRNKIMSLKDGTMAWHLAGFEVVHGATRRPPEVSERGRRAAIDAAAGIAKRTGIPRIEKQTLAGWRAEADRRTLYVLDVRTPEEYLAGHLAGARSVPGGQLVQETDAHIATWNARVVLVDDNGVRATMTASWLKQMGWNDVSVLVADASAGDWEIGPRMPRVLGLAGAAVQSIEPAALQARLAAADAAVIDLETSRRYAQGHIPGAWFALRSRLAEDLGKLPKPRTFVLSSPDGALARLAAAELASSANTEFMVLAGGTEAWKAAGLPLETGLAHMASEPDDVVLSARERGQGREEAMREYLAWEIDLVNQMATDDDQRFRVVTG
jgi:rhodanese-related sulfurtransferase